MNDRFPGASDSLKRGHAAFGPDTIGRQEYSCSTHLIGTPNAVCMAIRHRTMRLGNFLADQDHLDGDNFGQTTERWRGPQPLLILGARIDQISILRIGCQARKVTVGQKRWQAHIKEQTKMSRTPDRRRHGKWKSGSTAFGSSIQAMARHVTRSFLDGPIGFHGVGQLPDRQDMLFEDKASHRRRAYVSANASNEYGR